MNRSWLKQIQVTMMFIEDSVTFTATVMVVAASCCSCLMPHATCQMQSALENWLAKGRGRRFILIHAHPDARQRHDMDMPLIMGSMQDGPWLPVLQPATRVHMPRIVACVFAFNYANKFLHFAYAKPKRSPDATMQLCNRATVAHATCHMPPCPQL